MSLEEQVRELLGTGEPRTRIARRFGIRPEHRLAIRGEGRVSIQGPASDGRGLGCGACVLRGGPHRGGVQAPLWLFGEHVGSGGLQGDVVPRDPPTKGRPRGETREKVAELLAAGIRPAEVARSLGISKPTVSYHARKLGVPARNRCEQRYDWAAVQRAHDDGLSVRECSKRFGFALCSLHAAVKRGAIMQTDNWGGKGQRRQDC